MKYEAAIGIEVHVQLKTQSKLFCGCRTSFGDAPNTNVCPVCLGYPGAMPALNEEAIRKTVMAGLMVGSAISAESRFDRKSYFYPDMPKNYQISQYDRPLCVGGTVEIETETGNKTIQLTRIHLEEDVGKNMHFAQSSGLDFNRAGIPLMEIVSEPDMTTPQEAFAFLQALRQMMVFAGVSDCNLEEGNLRCDINCSMRPEGRKELGTKIEIKNMNSFKGILNALEHEIVRQVSVLEAGGTISQETRRWDLDAGVTVPMRTKEDAHDYRYFPEPDLMPVALAAELVERWRRELPERPRERRRRFVTQYGIPDYDAGVLTAEKSMADFFEETAKHTSNYKAISNWLMTEVLRCLSETHKDIADLRLTPRALGELIGLVDGGTLNSNTAKEVFAILLENGGEPGRVVESRGLAQVSDSGAIGKFVRQAVEENPKSADDYRGGKKAAMQHLVGQVMRLSRGKADPKVVAALLKQALE